MNVTQTTRRVYLVTSIVCAFCSQARLRQCAKKTWLKKPLFCLFRPIGLKPCGGWATCLSISQVVIPSQNDIGHNSNFPGTRYASNICLLIRLEWCRESGSSIRQARKQVNPRTHDLLKSNCYLGIGIVKRLTKPSSRILLRPCSF